MGLGGWHLAGGLKSLGLIGSWDVRGGRKPRVQLTSFPIAEGQSKQGSKWPIENTLQKGSKSSYSLPKIFKKFLHI